MDESIKRKLRVLFNILNTCVSQEIISLDLAVSIKYDASKNHQFIDDYTNIYTKLWASYND
jgi:hypothetical protein